MEWNKRLKELLSNPDSITKDEIARMIVELNMFYERIEIAEKAKETGDFDTAIEELKKLNRKIWVVG
jgi:hypothetical protein